MMLFFISMLANVNIGYTVWFIIATHSDHPFASEYRPKYPSLTSMYLWIAFLVSLGLVGLSAM